ncbi:hypothetical protein LTR37_011631 [Vermiconidia calcicola]|uniref:Uncharacterized protein n=1 Tax=Vermiconidia calcicola TaxID=1690605 RepID=A0ACC3N1D3_9PEZI|nr:hypothetical protein LTR37_011631 [Vermiconidia calcicola]
MIALLQAGNHIVKASATGENSKDKGYAINHNMAFEANVKPYNLPENAVWLVTGCSSGIGAALAHHIATQHPTNRIVATARNINSLNIPNIPNTPNVLKSPLDVTSIPSIDAALSTTLSHFGRLDVLVNNAGYTLVGDTEAAGDAEARALMDTNFWGMVDLSKRAIRIMREENPKSSSGGGGVILNVSSMGGYFGFPACSFYHASKFAMEGWTESVAKELPAEWNIHLCCIEPGGIRTNYASSSMKMMEARHPAYADPSFPTNVVIGYMRDPASRDTWAEPEAVAKAMWEVVGRGGRIPVRVPLGRDAWGMVMEDVERTREELEGLRALSESVV